MVEGATGAASPVIMADDAKWARERDVKERLFDIIYEDDALLVINKPAGLVCHPTKTDEYSSLISRTRLHLGKGSHPQLVNRLDRETERRHARGQGRGDSTRVAANLGEPASREGLCGHRARARGAGARDDRGAVGQGPAEPGGD